MQKKKQKSKPKQEAAQGAPLSFVEVGSKVFIRTVTSYFTGRVKGISKDEFLLEEAAWVADTDRFGKALLEGTLGEVEPYPDPIIVNRGAIVEVTLWRHELPRTTK